MLECFGSGRGELLVGWLWEYGVVAVVPFALYVHLSCFCLLRSSLRFAQFRQAESAELPLFPHYLETLVLGHGNLADVLNRRQLLLFLHVLVC